ncbi:hypothetical protein K488DRAFT_72644 [Vararia minispora EC-137]|uniref:Uncharacterized protein n=1 Tax=Vararia minispora EC-137 TaxID=1314806 RepID=A0ACB8QE43_9AGAM|nr:hypothetical protein K488DRAFT_72644 [Vararia minispora EC-137]
MSSSLSAEPTQFSSRAPSGKTPPPAPSAAYAKRAREMQEPMIGRYRPPALRALAVVDATVDQAGTTPISETPTGTLPPPSFQPGFRRARAGTLPSNVSLAAQQYAAERTPTSAFASTESFSEQLQLREQQQLQRPGLRHSTSVASTIPSSALGERNSRLRSGSLTTPATHGLGSAFGSGLFNSGSSWLAGGRADAGGYGPMLEESSQDDFDVHTLDYLGLDDRQRIRSLPPPAATITELRNQAQAAIASNLSANPPRMRATTVSHPYRGLRQPQQSHEEEDEMYDSYAGEYVDPRLGGTPPQSVQQQEYFAATGPAAYAGAQYKSAEHLGASLAAASRPRAISVGNLDEPVRLSRRATVSVEQPVYDLAQAFGASAGPLTPGGLLKPAPTPPSVPSPQDPGKPRTPRFPPDPRTAPYLVAPTTQQGGARAHSPKAETPGGAQVQTPTRSLWIGNLDNSVTSEQLIHVFAPYGAIESLRLLPEKRADRRSDQECGFVNFVDQADAIRAKDDVLNRLGGNIGMPNGQTVRIGFGKADSAPAAPGKSSSSATSKTTGANGSAATGGLSGMEAQLQSTPTRALWIGSIPSTTTPATILSVFSPYGPIESARVLTHKNCGFINFERLDDAVRARKALNGRDVLGPDVGAIRIGFAKVPVKGGAEPGGEEPQKALSVQGVGDLSVGATIHALRSVKGAATVPVDQQVLGGMVENYRSNLLLSMISAGTHTAAYINDGTAKPAGWTPTVTEQQMIMKELAVGAPEAEADVAALAEFRPPTMYYTTIPLVSERPHNRRWDASKLRELRKRMDAGLVADEEIEQIAADFVDGELVDLASDWLGNTVVQKLFEKCSVQARFAMLERVAPHLAMIGIHKNGTWAAQKIIECVQTPEEIALVASNLRPYAPPLLLDQFGNYVVQCCLRFGQPANDFIFDAMVDRLWEIAQGRFGARSMRACLESANITTSQQRRVATAIILNSIPLATNPNGALLLTWLLDTSSFPSRYLLLAPRFTPHLSHLCTHKLASLTVLRIVNQKTEPEASAQVVDALFNSPQDHVLTDVLGDQVNGVAVVHKVLTSPYLDLVKRPSYVEATKRVLIELKVIATQAYRRLIEEVGLPIPNFPTTPGVKAKFGAGAGQPSYGLPSGYSTHDQNLASMMAALQMGGQNAQSGQPQLSIDPAYPGAQGGGPATAPAVRRSGPGPTFSPAADPYNPFGGLRSPDSRVPRRVAGGSPTPAYVTQSPSMVGMGQPAYGAVSPLNVPPELYQQYMYNMYQQSPPPPNMGTFHA